MPERRNVGVAAPARIPHAAGGRRQQAAGGRRRQVVLHLPLLVLCGRIVGAIAESAAGRPVEAVAQRDRALADLRALHGQRSHRLLAHGQVRRGQKRGRQREHVRRRGRVEGAEGRARRVGRRHVVARLAHIAGARIARAGDNRQAAHGHLGQLDLHALDVRKVTKLVEETNLSVAVGDRGDLGRVGVGEIGNQQRPLENVGALAGRHGRPRASDRVENGLGAGC